MAVTKSWELSQEVRFGLKSIPVPGGRRRELFWLLGASLAVAAGLALVLLAKTEDFTAQQARLESGELINLNTATSQQQLLPFLQVYADPAERESVAEKVWGYLRSHPPLPNVGALARLRVSRTEERLPLANLKSFFCVRTPREFWREACQWLLLYLAAFWATHL